MKRSVKNFTDKQIADNLKAWCKHADDDMIKQGKEWYKDAQTFTKEMATKYKIDAYRVAGVVAALSPNNRWERNKIDAEAVISAWAKGYSYDCVKVCTYGANKRKAFGILEGRTEITAKSPKTHAFAMNVGLNSPDHITIDKWHLRACVTRPGDGVTDCVESCTAIQYRRLEAITAKVASDVNFYPMYYHVIAGLTECPSGRLKGYQLQAIIWVTIKKEWKR